MSRFSTFPLHLLLPTQSTADLTHFDRSPNRLLQDGGWCFGPHNRPLGGATLDEGSTPSATRIFTEAGGSSKLISTNYSYQRICMGLPNSCWQLTRRISSIALFFLLDNSRLCLIPLHGHKKPPVTKKLHVVSPLCVVDLLLYRSPRIVVASCCLARDLVEVRGNSTQFLN
jgi:hypothetical protein